MNKLNRPMKSNGARFY